MDGSGLCSSGQAVETGHLQVESHTLDGVAGQWPDARMKTSEPAQMQAYSIKGFASCLTQLRHQEHQSLLQEARSHQAQAEAHCPGKLWTARLARTRGPGADNAHGSGIEWETPCTLWHPSAPSPIPDNNHQTWLCKAPDKFMKEWCSNRTRTRKRCPRACNLSLYKFQIVKALWMASRVKQIGITNLRMPLYCMRNELRLNMTLFFLHSITAFTA